MLWLMADGGKHTLFTRMFGSVLCLLKWQATFFFFFGHTLFLAEKENQMNKEKIIQKKTKSNVVDCSLLIVISLNVKY